METTVKKIMLGQPVLVLSCGTGTQGTETAPINAATGNEDIYIYIYIHIHICQVSFTLWQPLGLFIVG